MQTPFQPRAITISILCLSFLSGSVVAQGFDSGLTAALEGRYQKSAEYWKRSAPKGNPEAQYALGYLYERGLGIEQNYQEAVKWYRLAAGQQHYWAKISLALLLAKGLEEKQNISAAKKLISSTAAQSGPERRYEIALLFSRPYPIFEPQDAMKWMRSAARDGSLRAQKTLALWYANGTATSRDVEKAEYWMRNAAEQGYLSAQVLLGRWYAEGTFVGGDHLKAYKWFSRAAAQGHRYAQEKLDEIGKTMSPTEIAQAKSLADEPPQGVAR